MACKKSAWYILMHFCLFKNGIAHVYDVYTIYGHMLGQNLSSKHPLWASLNVLKPVMGSSHFIVFCMHANFFVFFSCWREWINVQMLVVST